MPGCPKALESRSLSCIPGPWLCYVELPCPFFLALSPFFFVAYRGLSMSNHRKKMVPTLPHTVSVAGYRHRPMLSSDWVAQGQGCGCLS